MAIITNLYPPIVSNVLPSFIRTQSCKIYFSLSAYNTINDIKNIQISVVNQRTNISALKPSLYPSGIKIAQIFYDPEVSGDFQYYTQINPSDLVNESFEINQFYKVQLRLTSSLAASPPSYGTALATWLYDNRPYFSEWSKVCLIRGIEQPKISVRGFNNADFGAGVNERTIFTTPLIEITGKLDYQDSSETEYLKSYYIELYEENNLNTPLLKSEEIYTNQYTPNEINYSLNYDLIDGINYLMCLTYTTNNLYTQTLKYYFMILQNGKDDLNATIQATPDKENGCIKINIVSDENTSFIGNLTIRRASSKTGFHSWEDIKTLTFNSQTPLNISQSDITIESGVWYKYCAQKRNAYGDRGPIIQIQNPVMCVFEDIFLTRNNRQLKIKLNPSLSEFKYNVTESQQTAIGAKYPFIKRNGNNFYRSFPIGGLISSFMDTTNWFDPLFYDGTFHQDQSEIGLFTTKQKLYGDSLNLYENYNSEHGVSDYNDYIYERFFREEVYNFLYQNNIKLFRSTTEGNILIKLMNIDFQPIGTLGRRLYSFTATAIEVDDANISNYEKYGIQTIGTYRKYIAYTLDPQVGQISGTYDSTNGNIIETIISPKYQYKSSKDFINSVKNLNWFRIEITSQPYVIIEEDGKLVKATSQSTNFSNPISGYIVIINGQEIVIRPSMIRRRTCDSTYDPQTQIMQVRKEGIQTEYVGYFELKEPNTLITDIHFKYPTTAMIDYTATVKVTEDISHLINRIYYYEKAGQLHGIFDPSDSLIRKIYNKYYLKYSTYYQQLIDISGLKVEGAPGTVIYIKDSNNTDVNRFVLENGFLQLYNEDTDAFIEGLYFGGLHMVECKDPIRILRRHNLINFTVQEGVYSSTNDVLNPTEDGVYQILAYQEILAKNKSKAYFDDGGNLLILAEDQPSYESDEQNEDYTLIFDTISLFVYHRGKWYLLVRGQNDLTPLQSGIQHIRKNQYIPVEGYYNSFDEIVNPVPNGVYWVATLFVNDFLEEDNPKNNLTVGQEGVYPENNGVILQAEKIFSLVLRRLYEESKNRYIYYNNKWYHFTIDHDVLCPVEGIVDYYCEVMRGVY